MESEVVKKIILGISLLGILLAADTGGNTYDVTAVSQTLCKIIGTIKAIATVLGVAMFVVGGILYAIGNILTGGMKQTAHAWAQGLIIGGVVAIVLVIIAEPLVNLIAHDIGNLPGTPVNC
jgi:drug/metabolite transporter (DMT)-like permease